MLPPVTSPQVQLILEALELSEADVGAHIMWKDEEFPCTAGPIFGGKRLDEGGWREQSRCAIKVRLSLFDPGQEPQEKKLIQLVPGPELDPVTFRIESINKYHGYILELLCEDPNRGG